MTYRSPRFETIEELAEWAERYMASRPPDEVIGEESDPYLRRWLLFPKNPFQNQFLHEVLRSDDDRALHDHPWDNTSIGISGTCTEVVGYTQEPWREALRRELTPGTVINRHATDSHRLLIPEGGRYVSLFRTGPKQRAWGFWCPGDGEREPRWVHWRQFTAGPNGELVGLGCDA